MRRLKQAQALAWLRLLVFLLVLSIQPVAAVGVFSSRIIQGTILDAGTKAPIEGVIVTASWILLPWGTSAPLATIQVLETVTDEQGQYTIPEWGPKTSLRGRLEDDEPMIRFFKPGYLPLVVPNNSVYHPGLENDIEHKIKEPIKRSDGHIAYRLYEPDEHQVKFGEKRPTFMLEPFEGTDEEYVHLLTNIPGYAHSLSFIRRGITCEWKQLPITFVALHQLKARLDSLNVKTDGIPYIPNFGNQDHCGSAEVFFKAYLK